MWTVLEPHDLAKVMRKVPVEVRAKYDVWVGIVRMSGPQGLRAIKGFHDEALSGKLAGHRSSRLGIKWRVIYRVEAREVRVLVEQVTPHVYRP